MYIVVLFSIWIMHQCHNLCIILNFFPVTLICDLCQCDSSVCLTIRPYAGWPMNHGLMSNRGKRFVSSVKCPDSLWGPPSPIFSGFLELFPLWISDKVTKIMTPFHLVPWLSMTGVIPPLPPIYLLDVHRVIFLSV